MPKGTQGQNRPADVIGAAVVVAKIARGIFEKTPERSAADEVSMVHRFRTHRTPAFALLQAPIV